MNENLMRTYIDKERETDASISNVNRTPDYKKADNDIEFNKYQDNLDGMITDFKTHLDNIKSMKSEGRSNSIGNSRSRSKKYEKYFKKENETTNNYPIRKNNANKYSISGLDFNIGNKLNEFRREKLFSFNPKTLEEKLQNAKNINAKIKETYKKIKSSSEKYVNFNTNSNKSENKNSNNLIPFNNTADTFENDRHKFNSNRDRNSSLNRMRTGEREREKTILNNSIESYQGSFQDQEELNNPDNPYAKLLNIREERIRMLTEKNDEKDIKISILNKEKKALMKAIEDLIYKFNPPRKSSVIKNDSEITARFANKDLNQTDDLVFRFLDLEFFIEDLIQENQKLRKLNHLNNSVNNHDNQDHKYYTRPSRSIERTRGLNNYDNKSKSTKNAVSIKKRSAASRSRYNIPSEDPIKVDSHYSPRNMTYSKFTSGNQFLNEHEFDSNADSNNRENFSFDYSKERNYNNYNHDYKLSSDAEFEDKYGYGSKRKDLGQEFLEDKYYLSTSHKHDQNYEKLENFNRKILNIKTKLDDINNDQRERRVLDSIRRFREYNSIKY